VRRGYLLLQITITTFKLHTPFKRAFPFDLRATCELEGHCLLATGFLPPSTPVDNIDSLSLSQSSRQIDGSPQLGTDTTATRFDRRNATSRRRSIERANMQGNSLLVTKSNKKSAFNIRRPSYTSVTNRPIRS